MSVHMPQPSYPTQSSYPPPGSNPSPHALPSYSSLGPEYATQPSTGGQADVSPVPSSQTYSGRGAPDSRTYLTRTPSPTPSERKALDASFGFSIQGVIQRVRHAESWRDYVSLAVIGILVLIVVMIAVFHDQIISALEPFAHWMYRTPGGWLIPIAIMIILSFPPLFGHEIVAMLCGFVWGPGIGFAIVVAGTLIGETLMFLIFKHLLRSYNERAQRNNITFAAFCNVIRNGGFRIVLAARYSAIPPHFTTAVFAASQLVFWQFLLAAVLALPRQFASVFIGTDLNTSGTSDSKTNKIATYIVLAVVIVVSIPTMRYIRKQITTEKENVVYARRKARQALMNGSGDGSEAAELNNYGKSGFGGQGGVSTKTRVDVSNVV
ncbi:hypothetical protein CONPUDRAFT_158032 [Coniophora puteana RWD-64-598 SS2]|uniref:Golgi apparatus membrane protein TVP38 n=1 Tax=Coniophora puteana (strain RWD-64-598) TaxID=741705 RepID=A0A5M3MDD7_CONPW|nr:uncharacterized protein CONPUDRAFT_158032 [Coniophora puteana RWD-64-598 SS2]EIW76880.1 hypothetical protein CONPUDRAFT_158032 [Coniophora puteana RWD-64-598 SS2]